MKKPTEENTEQKVEIIGCSSSLMFFYTIRERDGLTFPRFKKTGIAHWMSQARPRKKSRENENGGGF